MPTKPLLAAAFTAALLAASGSGHVALAQGAPQAVVLVRVDPQAVATGYRLSKVRGSTVYNESNE